MGLSRSRHHTPSDLPALLCPFPVVGTKREEGGLSDGPQETVVDLCGSPKVPRPTQTRPDTNGQMVASSGGLVTARGPGRRDVYYSPKPPERNETPPTNDLRTSGPKILLLDVSTTDHSHPLSCPSSYPPSNPDFGTSYLPDRVVTRRPCGPRDREDKREGSEEGRKGRVSK